MMTISSPPLRVQEGPGMVRGQQGRGERQEDGLGGRLERGREVLLEQGIHRRAQAPE